MKRIKYENTILYFTIQQQFDLYNVLTHLTASLIQTSLIFMTRNMQRDNFEIELHSATIVATELFKSCNSTVLEVNILHPNAYLTS